MQPASPIRLPAMCEGWGAHKRSSKDPPATQQNNKINNNIQHVRQCPQSSRMQALVRCSSS
jgi:hypothetical protein